MIKRLLQPSWWRDFRFARRCRRNLRVRCSGPTIAAIAIQPSSTEAAAVTAPRLMRTRQIPLFQFLPLSPIQSRAKTTRPAPILPQRLLPQLIATGTTATATSISVVANLTSALSSGQLTSLSSTTISPPVAVENAAATDGERAARAARVSVNCLGTMLENLLHDLGSMWIGNVCWSLACNGRSCPWLS